MGALRSSRAQLISRARRQRKRHKNRPDADKDNSAGVSGALSRSAASTLVPVGRLELPSSKALKSLGVALMRGGNSKSKVNYLMELWAPVLASGASGLPVCQCRAEKALWPPTRRSVAARMTELVVVASSWQPLSSPLLELRSARR